MMLRTATASTVRPAPARRVAIVSRAGLRDLADSLGEGFVRIFSPPRISQDIPSTGMAQGYSRSTAKRGSRKPFADNFASTVALEQQDQQAQEDTNEAASYLGGAMQRLIGHNFVGEETEPNWKATGNSGWTGEIHSNDRDG